MYNEIYKYIHISKCMNCKECTYILYVNLIIYNEIYTISCVIIRCHYMSLFIYIELIGVIILIFDQ